MIEVNTGNGLYDDAGMIDSVVVLLNQLEVKGVVNMKIVFDCISRLSALQKSLVERKEEKQNAEA